MMMPEDIYFRDTASHIAAISHTMPHTPADNIRRQLPLVTPATPQLHYACLRHTEGLFTMATLHTLPLIILR